MQWLKSSPLRQGVPLLPSRSPWTSGMRIPAVEMNRQRINAATKTKELAERQLDAEQKKFELGSGQIRFVLQEQQNVTAAQTSEIAALVNYTKALVEFDQSHRQDP